MAEPKTTKSLNELREEIIAAAIRWRGADIYVHPILDREQAVKVGAADLIDAVQNYVNALPPQEAKSE